MLIKEKLSFDRHYLYPWLISREWR